MFLRTTTHSKSEKKMKEDITNSPRFQRILHEAAEYRLLRDIFKSADRRVNDEADSRERPPEDKVER
jgi:hypothetical protein